jgi:sporulation protein YlmC with PRC-barrel domain
MLTSNPVQTGSTVFDTGGSKIGTVSDVILDPATLQPEWYEVKIGHIGGHHLIPAECLAVDQNRCSVPFEKESIKGAPSAATPPSDQEREALRVHYRLS